MVARSNGVKIARRRFGKSGLSIPVVPLGTTGFGSKFGDVADDEAVKLIKRAIELGVNHLDCSRCYGDSLRKLAIAMKEIKRDDVIITGRVCAHAKPVDYSADHAVRDVEDQLRLLGIDRFDGMFIHDPGNIDAVLAKGATWDGLKRLKKRGLTSNIGMGMHPIENHLKVIRTGEADILLFFNEYNLLRRDKAEPLLEAAAERDMGVLNGWCIVRGILTGRDVEQAAKQGLWRLDSPDIPRAKAIREWCIEQGVSMLALAIQLCLREERIHGNPIAPRTAEELEANVTAASEPLPKDIWERFEEAFG